MAELALAIVPLCIQGLKLGRRLTGRLTKMGSYMDTVEEVRAEFNAQGASFLGECKEILRAALKGCDTLDADVLLDDLNHEGWGCQELDERLRAYLRTPQSLQGFKSLVGAICKRITEMEDRLDCFDEADSRGREGGTIAHRTGHKIKVSFDREEYDKENQKIRTLVSDLRRFRKLAVSEAAQLSSRKKEQIPEEFRKRREDAQLWLKAVSVNWSCKESHHSHHAAKLLLAASLLCLDVVIERDDSQKEGAANQKASGPPNRHFCVQPGSVLPLDPATGLLTPEASAATDTLRDELDEPNPQRRRRGSGDDVSTCRASQLSGETLANNPTCPPVLWRKSMNLSNRPNLCTELSDPQTYTKEIGPHSLGFLECGNRRFDFRRGHCPNRCPKPVMPGALISLTEIFRRDIDECVSDRERIWLADVLVKSALRHYGSTWWPHDWTLDNLAFYERGNDELIDSLRTLHVSADLERRTPAKARRVSAIPADITEAMRRHGIRNLTLWCIGVALLQIGLWRPIRWEDILGVRNSVALLQTFNRQYHDMTYKLIHCDFGKGDNLGDLALQNKVYWKVVCELGAIKEKL